jgi:STE24 endopeptidase
MITTTYYLLLFFVIFEFVVLTFLDYLNTRNWSNKLPEELKGIYDEEKYAKSMEYEKTKFKFSTINSIFSFLVILFCIIFRFF